MDSAWHPDEAMSPVRSHKETDDSAYRWWAEVSGADVANRFPTSVLVLTEAPDGGGYFLEGYDRNGRETTSTWHGARAAAKEWAGSEHAPGAIGSWRIVPEEVTDPAQYALTRRR
jgi:hypothetical protein